MTSETDPGKGHSRYMNCYWIREDLRVFSDILTDEFPGLRICTLDANKEKIEDHDNIVDIFTYGVPWILLPDPGWAPEFHVDDPKRFPDSKSVKNPPGRTIGIEMTEIREHDLSTFTPDEKWWPNPPSRRISICGKGHIQSYYHDSRPEEKRFVAKVFRLVRKFMTNSLEVFDLHTGEVVEVVHGSILWSGPEVVRRCRDDEDFFLYMNCLDLPGRPWVGAKAIPKPPRKGSAQ